MLGYNRPVVPAYLIAFLLLQPGRPWVLANSHLRGWARRLLPFDRPEQWHGGSGGAGVGYGIGAALGVGLAYRGTDTVVVNVQPDGDLLYCTSAIWTAASEQLPVLGLGVLVGARDARTSHDIRVARGQAGDLTKMFSGAIRRRNEHRQDSMRVSELYIRLRLERSRECKGKIV